MRCLICKQEITETPSWKSLLLLNEMATCEECFQQFEKISGSTCPLCHRPQTNEQPCQDCMKWQEDSNWRDILERNVSIFTYNEAMKEVLATYKFRGDAALSAVFRQELIEAYNKFLKPFKLDIAIPIPLSKERLYERGFNQAKLFADFLPLPQLDTLTRSDDKKQSKKSRHERLLSENVFSLRESSKIEKKQILLVDDLYTTGSTLRHAAKILLQNGAEKVYSLTLIRS